MLSIYDMRMSLNQINIKDFFTNFTDNERKIVIFCPSYPSVQIVLSILERLYEYNNKVEIIVNNDDLLKLFNELKNDRIEQIINLNEFPVPFRNYYDLIGLVNEKI